MKILMTSDTFLPRIGGAEIHVQNLVERMIEMKHEVVLITCEPNLSSFDTKINVTRINWSKKNLFKIMKQIWLQSKDVDIIHSHYCYRLALISGIVGKIRRKPVMITLHGLGILNHPGTPFIYHLAHASYRYFSLKLSTHVISTSQDLANVAYAYISKRKISIIPNGYNERIFNNTQQPNQKLQHQYSGKKIIMTVRRLVPKNGIHFLVETMPYILQELPEALYLMIGDGRMSDYIQKRIVELKLEKNIISLGTVNNTNVPDYLKIADVVVFPSTAESSSIACAEALGMGKAVVASSVGGLVELLGEHNERGSLVKLVEWTGSNYDAPLTLPKDSYEALAHAIIEKLRHSHTQKEEKAAEYAQKNLSWHTITRKTLETYFRFL